MFLRVLGGWSLGLSIYFILMVLDNAPLGCYQIMNAAPHGRPATHTNKARRTVVNAGIGVGPGRMITHHIHSDPELLVQRHHVLREQDLEKRRSFRHRAYGSVGMQPHRRQGAEPAPECISVKSYHVP